MGSWLRRWLVTGWVYVTTGPGRDRGVETVDKALWIGITIVVAGGIGLLFRDAVESFFNSLVFEIGLGD
jgi:hypothetical protein